MLKIRSHGGKDFFSICRFTSHFLYTSPSSSLADGISPATQKPHLNSLVDYLITSLGFSQEAAISASSKLKVTPNLKSTENADSVVDTLKKCGFDDTQIKEIVSSFPQILKCRANQNLEPKIRAFQEFGFSGSDILKLIKKNPRFIRVGLHTRIIPTIEYLRKLLGNDLKVVQVINEAEWMFYNNPKLISANVPLLQSYGFSLEQIVDIFFGAKIKNINIDPKRLEDRLRWFEAELGVPRGSPMLIHCVKFIGTMNLSQIEKKLEVYRSFGWSDSEVSALLKALPLCLTHSEAKIRDKLNFFMKELGFTPSYLTVNTALLTLSLETRVKPRYQVWKILKDKMLVNRKPSFYTIMKYSELEFLKFMRRFEKEIPTLHLIYSYNMRKSSQGGEHEPVVGESKLIAGGGRKSLVPEENDQGRRIH